MKTRKLYIDSVQPESGITTPERGGKPLEEVVGSVPWWDPKTDSQEMANAGNGINCFLALATQGLHH